MVVVMGYGEIPVSLRQAIVTLDAAQMNVAEFCRVHGVSRSSFYELRRRYAEEGEAGLVPKSRAPHHPAGRISAEIEDRIVAIRKELVEAGLDAGPATIAFHLRDLDGVPSGATIWRTLRNRGLITEQPSKAPKKRGSFTAQRANECWALDDTTWQLADGTEVKILNVIDDHSRLLVASTALGPSCTGAASLAALSDAAQVLGWPERFWADNAKAFKDVLATALTTFGVAASHTRPYHPHSNGKVERFHQTLKKWLARQPPAATLIELQYLLNCFRWIYNHQRPHRSINRAYPADIWANAPKTGPSTQPLGTPTTTHTSTVHNGRASAAGYLITIGATHNGQPALTIITDNTAHVFVNGHLTRQLTLNPTTRNQPIQNRPGRPTPTPTVHHAPRHL